MTNGNGEKITRVINHWVTWAIGVVIATIAVTSYFNAPVVEVEKRVSKVEQEHEIFGKQYITDLANIKIAIEANNRKLDDLKDFLIGKKKQ